MQKYRKQRRFLLKLQTQNIIASSSGKVLQSVVEHAPGQSIDNNK